MTSLSQHAARSPHGCLAPVRDGAIAALITLLVQHPSAMAQTAGAPLTAPPATTPANPTPPQAGPAQGPGAEIAGVWLDHTGRGAIEIAPCGPTMCGRIVWLQDATTPRGEPLTDQRNPNAAQRTRPICGLPVITALARKSDGTWDNGKIYNPEDGGTFDVAVKPLPRGNLEVVGYAGLKLFSQTYTWRRAPPNLARCDAALPARAAAPSPPSPQPPGASAPPPRASNQRQ
jgi:uncharacterized protein (DUF2147 family)